MWLLLRAAYDDRVSMASGVLYCGDNLDVLSEFVASNSVDLIYLDPPFNSKRTFNIVYKESKAQEAAFKDYWSWEESASTYARLVDSADTPRPLRVMLRGLHDLLIEHESDLLAYLAMMTARLIALHRVLKPTGTLYLHCDPTASHYLKMVLDALFGPDNFHNEIIWRRTNARSAAGRWPRLHDVILFYGKGERATFNPLLVAAEEQKLPHTLVTGPDGKKYQSYELTAPNLRYGETGKPWRGFQPAKYGRCWANPPSVMDEWDRQGLIHWPKKKGAWPRRRAAEPFRPEARMVTVGDVWTDIDRVNQSAKERMGYPTQKPLALLERIILASSNPGDLVLDPFCGCGTTVEACEKLGRRWIGIDMAARAVEVIEERFRRLGDVVAPRVVWHPVDVQAAAALADRDKAQFESWVRRKVRATRRRKKDRGIDGEATFRDDEGKLWHVIVSAKGGKLKPADLRDLRGTIERERAAVGVLVVAQAPSKEMRLEAARAGFMPGVEDDEGPIPRLQIVGIEKLFSDRPAIRCPGKNVTTMPRSQGDAEQLDLPLERPGPRRRQPAKPLRSTRPPPPTTEEFLSVAQPERPKYGRAGPPSSRRRGDS